MYDTDIGFGYGGRVKLVDFLSRKESFDLILFNSTKGERWYVFTFSMADPEIRQGTRYGLAFDLKAEYVKFLSYSFYGFGAGTPEEDQTVLTHATTSLSFLFSRGFTPHLVAEAAYVVRWLRYTEPREGPLVDELAALTGEGRLFAPYLTFALKYDTSDSQIHPTRGFRFILQEDLAGSFMGSRDASFSRLTVDFRNYLRVFGEKDVFAVRALAQYVGGASVPVFDHASLGGNVFTDAGTVWHSLRTVDLGEVAVDAGIGLRFYMPDFVVRVDAAWSREGMGLYFNFGHIF